MVEINVVFRHYSIEIVGNRRRFICRKSVKVNRQHEVGAYRSVSLQAGQTALRVVAEKRRFKRAYRAYEFGIYVERVIIVRTSEAQLIENVRATAVEVRSVAAAVDYNGVDVSRKVYKYILLILFRFRKLTVQIIILRLCKSGLYSSRRKLSASWKFPNKWA